MNTTDVRNGATDLLSSISGRDPAALRDLAMSKADDLRSYVSRKGANGIARDAVAVAKAHPIAAAAAAAGLAYLASKMIRR